MAPIPRMGHQRSASLRDKKDKKKTLRGNLGFLLSRFAILRREDYRWFNGDIIDSRKVCVIFHNILICMNENGCFAEDVSEEEGLLNVIEELYAEEEELADI